MKIELATQLQHSLRQGCQIFTTHFDAYHRHFLIGVLIIFLFWALQLFQQPINPQQQAALYRYLQHSSYPLSQDYAKQFQSDLNQEHAILMNRYHYFRLLRMLDSEQKRIHYQIDLQQDRSTKKPKAE